MPRVGWDLDGVVCRDDYSFSRRLTWEYGPLRVVGRLTRRVQERPPSDVIIITGRHRNAWWYTALWLRLHGIRNELWMSPFHWSRAAEWKSLVIASRGVTHYLESDEDQADEIARRWSNVVVIVYGKET